MIPITRSVVSAKNHKGHLPPEPEEIPGSGEEDPGILAPVETPTPPPAETPEDIARRLAKVITGKANDFIVEGESEDA